MTALGAALILVPFDSHAAQRSRVGTGSRNHLFWSISSSFENILFLFDSRIDDTNKVAIRVQEKPVVFPLRYTRLEPSPLL